MKTTYKVNKKVDFQTSMVYNKYLRYNNINFTHKFVENVSTNTHLCLHDRNLKFNPLNIIQLEGRRKSAIF